LDANVLRRVVLKLSGVAPHRLPELPQQPASVSNG
jgi:hypothetical protein